MTRPTARIPVKLHKNVTLVRTAEPVLAEELLARKSLARWVLGRLSETVLLVQPDESRADRGPAGVQSKREVSFDQPFIGVKAAADDLVSKPPVGVGAAVGCRWRLAPRDGRR